MNILIFTAMVVVILVLVWLLIDLAMGALNAPALFSTILKILAIVGGIIAICRRAGWL